MGAPNIGALKVRAARLEMENRALRAGLEAFARDFEATAEARPPEDGAAVVLRLAAQRMRGWIEVYDHARRVWDVQP